MKINISYLVIIILVVIAAVFYFSNSKGTLNKRASTFAIESIEEISKIEIMNGEKELVLTKENNLWRVNGKYQVKEWNINNFLTAANRIGVLTPVSNVQKEQIALLLRKDGIKVKFSRGNRIVRSYSVGKPGMHKSKTYMMMEKSSDPFVIRIPSFKGLVANLFVADENYWRDKTVFNYMPQNVKNIRIEYPENQKKSCKIINYNDGSFALQMLPSEDFIKEFNVEKTARFFTNFQKINFDNIADNLSLAAKDSILNSIPLAIISVEDFQNVVTSIKIFRKPSNGELDEFGEITSFDYNKAYGVLNNADELILIQYYKFDPILKEIDYFR
ncbi:MAG: hypothetical protein JEY96_07515 [Bacteroidales bacterium]|nr:hypothetical protein [Bacteroidales bacterium]